MFLLWAGKGQLGATGQEVPQNKRQAGATGPGREGKGVKREGKTNKTLEELLGPAGDGN